MFIARTIRIAAAAVAAATVLALAFGLSPAIGSADAGAVADATTEVTSLDPPVTYGVAGCDLCPERVTRSDDAVRHLLNPDDLIPN
jgi:hypothetical protein